MTMSSPAWISVLIVLLVAGGAGGATTAPSSQPGVTIHTIESEYQREPAEIHVLLPDRLEPKRLYPVLYVLPVYAEHRAAATAIAQAREENLHNRFDLICVTPSFDATPWYVDHPADPRARQESHLLEAVLPFVERNYPALREPRGRLLVGYSKSGWGAFTLLLRQPDVFGRAASFDAPMMMGRGGRFGPPDVMGPPEHFAKFRVLDLVARRAEMLRREPARLAVLGRGRFADDEVLFRRRLLALGIPHYWQHDTERKHAWTSGWLTPAVEALTRPDLAAPPRTALQDTEEEEGK